MKLVLKLISCRRLMTSRKILIRIFLLILVYLLYCNVSNTLNKRNKRRDSPNSYFSSIDTNTNTSSYLHESFAFEAVKASVKKRLDAEARSLKTVVRGDRSRHSLERSEYLMLVYTRVFGSEKFCEFESKTAATKIFVDECPYKNCYFTCDRSKAVKADLVLFHALDLVGEETETKVYLKQFLARSKTRKEQIWLLWHDEVKFL